MKVGLGTAQLGLPYGISNRLGRPSEPEASTILARALELGFKVWDTAPSYGDSEKVIGKYLAAAFLAPVPELARPGDSRPRVITKTLPLAQLKTDKLELDTSPEAFTSVLDSHFASSLRSLGLSSVYGLLVHHSKDLLDSNFGRALQSWLLTQKKGGLAKKIGFSCYTPTELKDCLNVFKPDLVQLPLNLLNQDHLEFGSLSLLNSLGVEVHIRSAFCQGLLLMDEGSLSSHFHSLRPLLADFRKVLTERGLSPLEGALEFLSAHISNEIVLVGVNSKAELDAIYGALKKLEARVNTPLDVDWRAFRVRDDRITNPSLWPSRE